MIILTIFFFITAILYSSIGFGGGSTYLALLLIWDVPYYIFPILALICNIIVVSGNSINFLKSKNINFNLLYPYLIGSIPLAFIGASISIEKNLFEILLKLLIFSAKENFNKNLLDDLGKRRIVDFIIGKNKYSLRKFENKDLLSLYNLRMDYLTRKYAINQNVFNFRQHQKFFKIKQK